MRTLRDRFCLHNIRGYMLDALFLVVFLHMVVFLLTGWSPLFNSINTTVMTVELFVRILGLVMLHVGCIIGWSLTDYPRRKVNRDGSTYYG